MSIEQFITPSFNNVEIHYLALAIHHRINTLVLQTLTQETFEELAMLTLINLKLMPKLAEQAALEHREMLLAQS